MKKNLPNQNKKQVATKYQAVKTNKPLKPQVKEEDLVKIPEYKGIRRGYIYAIIMALAFLLYYNTIEFGYVLDDGIVISKNEFTKKGIKGIKDIFSYDTMAGEHGKDVNFVAGGRYRPISVATFALEWEFFGENPQINHIGNIILYGCTGILIFLIFAKLFNHPKVRPFVPRWFFAVPFVTAILYMTHPVHTEVVANIKGRDEVMVMLGALLTFWFIVKYHDEEKNKSKDILKLPVLIILTVASTVVYIIYKKFIFGPYNAFDYFYFLYLISLAGYLLYRLLKIATGRTAYLILSFISFFIALLSKENAITFLAIIPFAIYFFTDKSLQKNIISILPLLIASLLFIVLRYKIIGNPSGTVHELMNNPFVDADKSQRYGTVFYTLLIYLRLLFFPYQLTWDYYPYHIPLVRFEDPLSVLPLFMYIGMGIYALLGLRKKNNVISYSILFYLAGLSIVSNLFFSIGAFMSERFVYLPSLGFSLLIAFLIVRKLPEFLAKKFNFNQIKQTTIVASLLIVIIALYTIKTIDRNKVWVDNFTLFTTDVLCSSESAKGNTTAGEQLVIKGMAEKDPVKRKEYFELSIKYLEKAIRIHPRYIAARLDLGIAYEKHLKDYRRAIDMYISTIKLKPDYDKAYNNINVIFTVIDSINLQFDTYEKLYALNPNRYDVNYKLGSLYGPYRKDLKKSISFLERAIQLNPKSGDACTDLGVAYGMSGEYAKAAQMLEKANILAPGSPLILGNLRATYTHIGDKEKASFYEIKAREAQVVWDARRQEMIKKQQEQMKKQQQNK